MKQSEGITRRQFLKTAAGAGAGLAATGAIVGFAPADPPAKWDKQADVVIVGFGGAGAAAALEARKAGASVLILEKQEQGGGSTAICGGIVYMGGGTAVQKACKIEDSVAEMHKYVLASSGTGADEELVKLYCDRSLELFDWVTGVGVKFKNTLFEGKYSVPPTDDGLMFSGNERNAAFASITKPVPRGHHVQAEGYSGPELFAPLLAAVQKSGAEIMYKTPVTRLVVDLGRVVGVEIDAAGKPQTVKANRAVVLAAGGFGNNKTMIANHSPKTAACGMVIGTPGDDGSGIQMGQSVGGDVRMMGEALHHKAIYQTGDVILLSGILVSDKGRRFVGEDNYGEWVGDAIVKEHPTSYLIVDDVVWKKASEETRKAGAVAQADTIHTLAERLQIPPAVLESTVSFYNQMAALGEDPEFKKDSHYVAPLWTPPFYAIDATAKTVGFLTTGGLRINAKAQVLEASPKGEPIPGLYAAGRCSFAVIAEHYPGSGTAVAEALIFGRIAGQNAAAEKLPV